MDANGKEREIRIKDVRYAPHFELKLFSITTALKNSMHLANEGLEITVENKNIKLSFDQQLRKNNGYLAGITIQPRQGEILDNKALASQKVIEKPETSEVKKEKNTSMLTFFTNG